MRRAWAAWSRFWFTPADPTPLCLMRIVAGLLTLYVHVAYTFDLHALFGPDAWYPTAMADRERREWPQFVLPTSWAPGARFRMPEAGDQRRALRVFIDNLARDRAGQEKALRLLSSVPATAEGKLDPATVVFLRTLPADPADREAKLRELVQAPAADADPEKRFDAERRFGPYLVSLPAPQREQFRIDAHALAELLPADPRLRGQLFDLLLGEGPRGVQVLTTFVKHVTDAYPDEAERAKYLEYTEYWSAPPDEPEVVTKGHAVYSPFFHVTDRTGINVLHGVHLAVIVLFTLGVCTRVTSVLTWLAGLAYIQRDQLSLFGQDTMMNLCLLYLMLAPCGATWSVDWLVNRYRAARARIQTSEVRGQRSGDRVLTSDLCPLTSSVSANVAIRLIQVNYCLMYLSAGLSKLKGNSWWNGTAPWYCMTNPEFSPLHLPAFRNVLVWLCQDQNRWLWEGYMGVMTVFTLVLELGFPYLVWTRLRPVMVCGAILLHLGIALNMGLIVFSLFMFALLLCWMPPAAIRTVFARPPSRLPKVEVRFSGGDPRQRRAAAAVSAADVWQQAELVDRGPRAADAGRPLEVVAGGQGGEHTSAATGIAAACRLVRDLGLTQWMAWFVCPLLRLPGLAHLTAALFGGPGGIAPAGDPHASAPADGRKRPKPVSSR